MVWAGGDQLMLRLAPVEQLRFLYWGVTGCVRNRCHAMLARLSTTTTWKTIAAGEAPYMSDATSMATFAARTSTQGRVETDAVPRCVPRSQCAAAAHSRSAANPAPILSVPKPTARATITARSTTNAHPSAAITVSIRRNVDCPKSPLPGSEVSRRPGFSGRPVRAAYSSKKNLQTVQDADATPYIPFRADATSLGIARVSPLWRRLFHYYNMEREGFLAHYHKRSNVETAFSVMTRKFGDALRSKIKVARFNEMLCKMLTHNLCCVIQSMHELGIDPQFATVRAA
jgi:hypothetical protein